MTKVLGEVILDVVQDLSTNAQNKIPSVAAVSSALKTLTTSSYNHDYAYDTGFTFPTPAIEVLFVELGNGGIQREGRDFTFIKDANGNILSFTLVPATKIPFGVHWRPSNGVGGITTYHYQDSDLPTSSTPSTSATLSSISLTIPSSLTEGSSGAASVKGTYSDGTVSSITDSNLVLSSNDNTITINGLTINVLSNTTTGDDRQVTITATYNGKTDSKILQVTDSSSTTTSPSGTVVLSNINISGPDSINEGSSGNYVVIATYSDGSTKVVTPTSISSTEGSFSGNQLNIPTNSVTQDTRQATINTSYQGKSTSKTITIQDKTAITYDANTLAYRDRVVNDGGTVYSLDEVQAWYTYLETLPGFSDGTLGDNGAACFGARLGTKLDSNGNLAVAYCLFNKYDYYPYGDGITTPVITISSDSASKRSFQFAGRGLEPKKTLNQAKYYNFYASGGQATIALRGQIADSNDYYILAILGSDISIQYPAFNIGYDSNGLSLSYHGGTSDYNKYDVTVASQGSTAFNLVGQVDNTKTMDETQFYLNSTLQKTHTFNNQNYDFDNPSQTISVTSTSWGANTTKQGGNTQLSSCLLLPLAQTSDQCLTINSLL